MMTEQLNAGIELLLVGMGIVFLFLAMLILSVNLMSALILRYFPQPAIPEKPAKQFPPGASRGTDATVIAAISAAVHQYRAKHK